MADAILVLNAGSSSVKFSLFSDSEEPRDLYRGQFDGLLTQPQFTAQDASGSEIAQKQWGGSLSHHDAVEFLLRWEPLQSHRIVAAGHRVVHGGTRFTGPTLVTPELIGELKALIPLAPLHQPHNVVAIEAVAQHAPKLPQVACFDTSFHHTQPAVARNFALPRKYTDQGVRRYGFHGLSYEYIASVLHRHDPRAAKGRTVVAHLGNGASMCALLAGSSVATTMGFTALDGLPMGTRSGSIDPGVLLYLMDEQRMDARALERLLYQESGFLGVSAVSSDMRALLESRDSHAGEAVDLFVYRIGRELGSLAAALGGLDALVFTAGIGENAATIRERVCYDAAWLGLEFDGRANAAGGPRISAPASRVAAWVIPTNEELMIARHTRHVLSETKK